MEIGGLNPKFWGQNPPPDMIETWAKNEAMFNLYLAQQLAQIRITSVAAAPSTSGAGLFDVKATVVNVGLIPTALDIAKRVKIVRPDTCTTRLAPGQELQKSSEDRSQPATIEIGWLKAGESGELKSEEQSKLKEHLLTSEECRVELEDQKNLLELISGKKKVAVDEKVLSAARYQLRGALRAERSSKNILGLLTENVYQFFTTPLRFAFAGAVLLVVGVLIGNIFFSKSSQSEFTGQQNGDNRFASLSEDISISDVRFVDSDASDGEVEFTLQASRPVHLKGNVKDPQIQSVPYLRNAK